MEARPTDWDERIRVLRDEVRTMPAVCTERSRLVTESYRETEGLWPALRRAKAFAAVMDKMTVSIGRHELIVGKATSKPRAAAFLPEFNASWVLDGMEGLSQRPVDRFCELTEAEKGDIREALSYWRGKSGWDMWQKRVPAERQGLLYNGVTGGAVYSMAGLNAGHLAVDFEKVLTQGLAAIKAEVDAELALLDLAAPDDYAKYPFLESARITLEAAPRLARRYADVAESMAKEEGDSVRKAELQEIADVCKRVPEYPARTFREAVQSVCFVWIFLVLEGWSYGISLGRIDQYLLPFYERDIAAGFLTEDEAKALISFLCIKASSVVTLLDPLSATVFAGFPQTVNFILGGVTPDGRDAVNSLSYLVLEADKKVGLGQNDLVIRIHEQSPDEWVEQACEAAKTLRGKLKFMGDETIIDQMLSDGFPLELARDYSVMGCNTTTVAGRSSDLPGGMFNLGLMLELALNDGKSRLTGEQIGPNTGDPRRFRSYEDVWNAYKKQVETILPTVVLYRNADRQLYAEQFPLPFTSTLFDGPIRTGRDMVCGNTALPYTRQAVQFTGAPTVGDSLAALRKAVFEEKKITMDQLLTALDANFDGQGELLQVLEGCPKFGNDDDYVDLIVNDVLMHARDFAVNNLTADHAKLNCAAAGVTATVAFGMATGALPDGRKAGLPLSEGGISPYQGRNVSGPVATLRSVGKIEHRKLTGGSVLNMRFSPGSLKDAASIRKFAVMLRTFLENGGFFVQFNIVDTDTLLAAQKDPEKYRDLLVRVATYSAYFVELSRELQDDIIRRMAFQEL